MHWTPADLPLKLASKPSHAESGASQTNHFNWMSAGEKLTLLLEHTTMHDVTPQASLALRGLSQKQRSPHIPVQSSPGLNRVSIVFSPATKPRLCPCDPPAAQKNLCHQSTRSPIFLLSHRRALEAFSMSDTNQLPVLTHHELPATRPTQSTQSSTALSDVTGAFDFSLRLYLRPVSARSVGHCPIRILGAKLIEGQFTALLNNTQWHFSAVFELVMGQLLSKNKL